MERGRRRRAPPQPDEEPQAQWARVEGAAAPPVPPQIQPPQAETGVLIKELREELELLKKQILVKGDLLEHLHISVKSELKEKIQSGKFVEFHELLKKSFKEEKCEDISGVDDGKGNFVFKATNNKIKKNIDIDKWCSAFHTFMSVYLQAHPSACQELLAYGELIREAARDHPGTSHWRDYDEQFRTRKASDPLRPWGMIDSQLWMSIFCKPSLSGQASTSTEKPPCTFFNSSKGCFRKYCWFKHVCSSCKSPSHAVGSCFKKGRKQQQENKSLSKQQSTEQKPFPFPKSKQ